MDLYVGTTLLFSPEDGGSILLRNSETHIGTTRRDNPEDHHVHVFVCIGTTPRFLLRMTSQLHSSTVFTSWEMTSDSCQQTRNQPGASSDTCSHCRAKKRNRDSNFYGCPLHSSVRLTKLPIIFLLYVYPGLDLPVYRVGPRGGEENDFQFVSFPTTTTQYYIPGGGKIKSTIQMKMHMNTFLSYDFAFNLNTFHVCPYKYFTSTFFLYFKQKQRYCSGYGRRVLTSAPTFLNATIFSANKTVFMFYCCRKF